MKSLNVIVVLLCLNSWAQDYSSAIEKARFLIQHHQKQTNIPGAQVAAMVDGELIWSESFGFKDLDNKIEVSKQTKFRIASVSKSLTSVAFGKMLETGLINLDDDIHKLVPEFPQKKYMLTPGHLASSTSGIRHYVSKQEASSTVHYKSLIHALDRFKNDTLLFEPGSNYEYSSYGWVLLGAAMEKVSQKNFQEIMQDTWDTIGMKNTSFDLPDHTDTTKTKFYIKDKNQRAIAPSENRSFMYPGGGYLSTAEDLVLMGNALLANTYLSEQTRNTLFEKTTLTNGTKINYGLGWEVGESRLKTSIVYHSGSMGTSRSHLILYPQENVVFAYVANTGDEVFFNDREAQSIAELFIDVKRNIENKSEVVNTVNLIGSWEIETTSLRDKKSKGTLQLHKNENGIIEGYVEFTRSRGKKEFPIILSSKIENKVHLIAVSPMFIDFYFDLSENTFMGQWLHDFNVNGTPEKDSYWCPRAIHGKK